MIIRQLNSLNEIQQFECIPNEYPDKCFPADFKYAVRNAFNLVKKGAFCRVVEKDNRLVSLGLAIVCQPYIYSKEEVLQQVFYHVRKDISMFSKVKAFKLFHKEMTIHAKTYCVRHCVSSSLLDNYPVFLEILRKEGWVIRGPTAVWTATGADREGAEG